MAKKSTTYKKIRVHFTDGTHRDVTHERSRRTRYTWMDGLSTREWVAVHPLDQGDTEHEVRRLARDHDPGKVVDRVEVLEFHQSG